MDKKFAPSAIFVGIIIIVFAQSHSTKNNFKEPAPYAHTEVLNDPIVFAKDIITTNDDEFGGTFTPDGKTCFFSKIVIQFLKMADGKHPR